MYCIVSLSQFTRDYWWLVARVGGCGFLTFIVNPHAAYFKRSRTRRPGALWPKVWPPWLARRLERAEQRLEKRYTHDLVTILRHLTGPPRSPTEGRVRRRPGCVHVQNVKRPRTASSSRQRLMWRSLNVVFAGQATSFVSAPGSRCVRSSFSMHPTVRRQGSARHGRREATGMSGDVDAGSTARPTAAHGRM